MNREPWDSKQFSRAMELHRAHGPIDLHVDSIIQQRLFRYDVRKRHRAGMWGQPFIWHADIPRMLEAAYGGACMGIHYFPWESERAWREMNTQIDYLDRIAREDPRCLRVNTPDDWDTAAREGLLAMAPGVEGTHMLNGKLERVAAMAQRGVSYLTLAHFSKNAAATPSLGRGANERDGLTDFGRALVRELNRHGIAIDVAHVNTPGVLEVCRLTDVPLFCTHTGVKGIYDSRRNLTDNEIKAIAELDGAIGIMAAPNFLAGTLKARTSTLCDHIDYVVRMIGPRHVALGTDFDGWIPLLADQRDCRDAVKITAELLDRGYSDDDIAGFLRGNALRVLRAVWDARQRPGSETGNQQGAGNANT